MAIGTILLSSIEEVATAPPFPVDIASMFGAKLLAFMFWPPWPLIAWPLIVCAVFWVVDKRRNLVPVLIYFVGLSVLYAMEISADAQRDRGRLEEQEMKAEMWKMMEELSGRSLPVTESEFHHLHVNNARETLSELNRTHRCSRENLDALGSSVERMKRAIGK